MPLSWDFYVQRRNIDLNRLIQHNKIDSYETLCGFLITKDVDPPERDFTDSWVWHVKKENVAAGATKDPVLETPVLIKPDDGGKSSKASPAWKRKKKKAPKKPAKKTLSKKV